MSFYTASGGPPVSEAMYNGGTQLGQNLSTGTADNYSFSLITNGVVALSIDTSQNVTFAGSITPTGVFVAPEGTAALPSYTFTGDLDTGVYHSAANTVAVSAGGTLRVSVNATSVTSTLPFYAPAGTAGAPAYSFASDTDSGMWSGGANNVVINVGGSTSVDMQTGGVFVSTPLGAPSGAVGAPGLSFTSDLDCGFYRIGANDIGFAVGGALALEVKGLDVVVGNAAIATSATSGFLWAPSCAGAATGTPANTFTGRTPIVFDSTNGRLYAYYGGAWKYAAVTT